MFNAHAPSQVAARKTGSAMRARVDGRWYAASCMGLQPIAHLIPRGVSR